MTTNPNLLAARLTGVLLSVVKHGDLPYAEKLTLLASLRQSHELFPTLASDDLLAEFDQLRQRLERELHELHAEERRRDELERFRDLDGDHEYERAERGPEHEYPR